LTTWQTWSPIHQRHHKHSRLRKRCTFMIHDSLHLIHNSDTSLNQ
jgi:hypothetical protein